MSRWCAKLWESFSRRASCLCCECCPGGSGRAGPAGVLQPEEVSYMRRGKTSRQALGSSSSELSIGATLGSAPPHSPAPQPPRSSRSDSVFLPEAETGRGIALGPTGPIPWRANRESVQPRTSQGAPDIVAGYAPPTSAPAGGNCPPTVVGPTSLQRYRFSYGPEFTADQIRKDLYHGPASAASAEASGATHTSISDSPPPPPSDEAPGSSGQASLSFQLSLQVGNQLGEFAPCEPSRLDSIQSLK